MTSPLPETFKLATCQCFPALKDGATWNTFIGEWFGDCVYTDAEYLSFGLGLMTLVLNFISLGPQIWLNFKNKATDGLSVSLLLLWLIGDIASLVGGILTDQLVTQKLLAFYFVFLDSITIFQCWYYAGPPVIVNPDDAMASGELNPQYSTDIPMQTYSSSVQDPRHSPTHPASSCSSGHPTDFDNEFSQNDFNQDEAELEKLLADNGEEVSPLLSTSAAGPGPASYQSTLKPGNVGKIKGVKSPNNTTSPTTSGGSKSKHGGQIIGGLGMLAILGCMYVAGSGKVTVNRVPEVVAASIEPMLEPISNLAAALPSCLRTSNAPAGALYAGIVISWISALLFCGSRVPQIINNYKFHQLGIPLDGLSPAVFLITALGNLTYGISVLLRNTIDKQFFITTFPFLLGSLGTILFDVVILYQIHFYNKEFQQRKSAVHTSSRFEEDEI